jgi:hypothetical protein
MIAEQTAQNAPGRSAVPSAPSAPALVGVSAAVRLESIRSTGWQKRLCVFSRQILAVAIALLRSLASAGNPPFFELERRGPVEHRLGPGLTRDIDSFWPLSQW